MLYSELGKEITSINKSKAHNNVTISAKGLF